MCPYAYSTLVLVVCLMLFSKPGSISVKSSILRFGEPFFCAHVEKEHCIAILSKVNLLYLDILFIRFTKSVQKIAVESLIMHHLPTTYTSFERHTRLE